MSVYVTSSNKKIKKNPVSFKCSGNWPLSSIHKATLGYTAISAKFTPRWGMKRQKQYVHYNQQPAPGERLMTKPIHQLVNMTKLTKHINLKLPITNRGGGGVANSFIYHLPSNNWLRQFGRKFANVINYPFCSYSDICQIPSVSIEER